MRRLALSLLAVVMASEAPERSLETTKILVFGPPGVGKGTQSKRLVQQYGVCHISTGDLLRKEVQEGSAIGKKVKSIMARGKLVPDTLVIRLVTRKLTRNRVCKRRGWLLDGFPRSASQVHGLINAGLVPNHIVVLNATNTTVTERTLARARAALESGETPRKDDNVETVKQRLAEYERYRDETLAALRSYLRISHVDGGGTQQAVGQAINRALDAKLVV